MIRQHRGALRSTLFFLLLAPLLLAQLQDDLPPVAVVSSDDPSLGHPHDGIDPPTDLVDSELKLYTILMVAEAKSAHHYGKHRISSPHSNPRYTPISTRS